MKLWCAVYVHSYFVCELRARNEMSSLTFVYVDREEHKEREKVHQDHAKHAYPFGLQKHVRRTYQSGRDKT